METLFRFIMARPAQLKQPEQDGIPVNPSAGLRDRLGEQLALPERRARAIRFLNSADAVHNLAELATGPALTGLAAGLAAAGETADAAAAETLIEQHFGQDPAALVQAGSDFSRDRQRLADTLIAAKLRGTAGEPPLDQLARLVAAAELVARLAGDWAALAAPGAVAAFLARPLVVGTGLLAGPPARPAAEKPPQNDESRRKRLAALTAQANRLMVARDELLAVPTGAYALPEENGAAASEPAPLPVPAGNSLTDLDPAASAPAGLLSGFPNSLRPAAPTPLALKPEAIRQLSGETRAALRQARVDLAQTSVPLAVETLGRQIAAATTQLLHLAEPAQQAFVQVGTSFLPADSIRGLSQPLAQGSVPATKGSLAPAGIGDLLVVKQNLKHYDARELSHVENILKGEFKNREHRRARTTEETITLEKETKKEEERDQQTTERFELKTETNNVIKEDSSLKLGLTVSGAYGPMIQFQATSDFGLNKAKEEATKVATSYSKDVVSRAASKTLERTREERILKTIEVFEEKNAHGFDNKEGAGHVVGQYQWLEKVYEAQVFNYGKRLLFDLMVPEPAAFLLYAIGSRPPVGADLVKPSSFTLKPTDLTEFNYAYYVSQYGASGVEAPPKPYVTVSKTFDGADDRTDRGEMTKVAEVPIPTGYSAEAAGVTVYLSHWDEGAARLAVTVGKRSHIFKPSTMGLASTALDGEVESIPAAVLTFRVAIFTATFDITCRRTDRALDEWKLKTHAAIMNAYQKQLRDYEEKLAALQLQAAAQFSGRSPDENRLLERAELKKAAISLLTAQFYDLFDAISFSTQGYPEPDLAEAGPEGSYIRFFEQAFEWEQMMYFFYPYYWGRKDNWLNRALLQDVDSLFAEFLKAGAARVVLAVRPGFEAAITHFLETGEIWNGGDLPAVTSPLYLSIIEEIRERDGAKGDEIPQGDPWDVHLPTTLVWLRPDNSLPAWHKDVQGDWVPD